MYLTSLCGVPSATHCVYICAQTQKSGIVFRLLPAARQCTRLCLVWMQTNLHPTHVILNYGHWMTGSSRDCGFKAPFSHCPYLPDVCEFLTGTHPFKVFWQTTSPRFDVGDTITDHHLHIPHACNLDQRMVLHRGLAFRGLEPDTEKQQWLFHDKLHLAPPAYHAFNGLLLDMVTKGASHR